MTVRRSLVVALLSVAACSGQVTVAPYPGNVWEGPGGEVVPTEELGLFLAPPGCGTERLAFLEIRWPLPGYEGEGEPGLRQYVRDPAAEVDPRRLLAPYGATGSLPAGAAYTGYHTSGLQLWVGPDVEIYVYLVAGPTVEALPRAEQPIDCS